MKQKLLRCGKLYDGIHRDIQEKVDILVDGDRIQAVGKNLRPDSGAEVLDLMHLTVTPGLIDAHIHTDILDWHDYWQNTVMRSDASPT